jgi:hypothetical protein
MVNPHPTLGETALLVDGEKEDRETESLTLDSSTTRQSPRKVTNVLRATSGTGGKGVDNPYVTLCVGGVAFSTSVQTLMCGGGILAELMQMNTTFDEPNPTFDEPNPTTLVLDRDPQMFSYVLDYLRNKNLMTIPVTEELRAKLVTESLYFGYGSLQAMVEKVINERDFSECIHCDQRLHVKTFSTRWCKVGFHPRRHTGKLILATKAMTGQSVCRWDCCQQELRPGPNESCTIFQRGKGFHMF